MKSPLGETIVGGIFRTSLICLNFVSAVCAKAIAGHAKAQATTSIIALFIVPILVQIQMRDSETYALLTWIGYHQNKGAGNEPSGHFMLTWQNFRGRDASYLAPPAQIRTGPIRAYGSHLGCLTAKRLSGHG
jgi:hypothetical protein